MNDLSPQVIQKNLSFIRQEIRQAAIQAGRNPETIRLVAVSKFHSVESVRAAIQAGQFIFGENRIQEGKKKFSDIIAEKQNIELHIIGPIQTNKLADAVAIASTLETIDRLSLLDPLEKAIQKAGRSPDLLIQINTGKEPQKAGIMPEETDAFITLCHKRFGPLLKGVMGIPPLHEDPAPHFKQLAFFARKHALPEISMGMSQDFRTAIAHGATIVRIGSAIFGERSMSA